MSKTNKQLKEEYNKKFTYAWFTWNGEVFDGVKFAKRAKKEMWKFIEIALTQRTNEVARQKNLIRNWTKGRKVTKDGLREFLNKL